MPLIRDQDATVALVPEVCEAPVQVLMIQDLEWRAWAARGDEFVHLFEELEPFRCIKVETVPAV